jgi:hypothetical protein
MFDRLIDALRRPRPAPPPRALDAARELVAAEEERVYGCGWFDSSHDLLRGLRVREHATPPPELPLPLWLELELAEWRGLAPG